MYLNSLSSPTLILNLFIVGKVRKQMAHESNHRRVIAKWEISVLYLDPTPSKYPADREVCRISGESFQPDLIDTALATRQRCPKSRESTRNRRYFSHEPPIIIPHANGKRYRAASNRNPHSHEALL